MASILPICIIIIFGALLFLAKIRWISFTGIVSKPLLTPNEIEFYYRLQKALPSYHVFPQVAFGAILKAKSGKDWAKNRGRFSQKIADYIVCEKATMNILAII